MNNDKKRLQMKTLFFSLILVGASVFFYLAFRKGGLNPQNYVWVALVFAILVFSFIIFIKRFKEIKKGLPLEDERSKKVLNLASSRAFYFTLYWLLAISTFEKFFAELAGLEHLTASQTTGGGILGMALAFLGFWIYYNHKANI